MESEKSETVVVTGAAGFIGAAAVREALRRGFGVVAVDKITYAGDPAPLEEAQSAGALRFVRADVADGDAMLGLLAEARPAGILHLAAETHVDRSIDRPEDFLRSNVEGTFRLLEAARAYLAGAGRGRPFRFHQVSTDEVYGDLAGRPGRFTEESRYAPSSPYSASKAAADHLVGAWRRTYGLPCVVSHTSNNYGPRQHPEKLIPRTIVRALEGEPLTVFGDGAQIRDWIHVEDHAAGLLDVFERGEDGEAYHIGAREERRNLEVVEGVCALLEELAPQRKAPGLARFADLAVRAADRPGHDRRYALEAAKIREALGWRPRRTFEEGLRETVRWYLDNEAWWRPLLGGGGGPE